MAEDTQIQDPTQQTPAVGQAEGGLQALTQTEGTSVTEPVATPSEEPPVAAGAEGEGEGAAAADDGEPPKPTRADRQWARLRQERRDLRTEVERLRQENEMLKKAPAAAAPQEFKPEPFTKPQPKVDDFEKEADPWAAYQIALGEYGAEKRLHDAEQQRKRADFEAQQAKRAEQQQAAARTAAEQWAMKRDAFVKDHADWEDKMEDLMDEVGRDLPPHLQYALIESEVGPAVLYHLADHPEEARKVMAMTPGRAAIAIGRIEAQLEAERKAQKPKAPPPNPPAVVKPSAPRSQASGDAGNFREYKARREAEMRRQSA
ncbi:MAG TPA: hypothetical protein VHI13_08845 [Candidatus Kapabacteria bacterium]|nr:hypothetical protein [Candidatus Kapabacteria bacterium]